jgi:hypothetical protein
MKTPGDLPMHAVIKAANELVLKNPKLPLLNDDPNFPPITQSIEYILTELKARKQLCLPNLQNQTNNVGIFSDYGGSAKGSFYDTYSFLICGLDHLSRFNQEMEEIRRTHGLDEPFKEIEFEALDYGPLARALDDYLIALNNFVPGLLFTLVVEKKISSLLWEDRKATHKLLADLLADRGLGTWKKQVAEKLLRVVHTIAYFVALLCKDGQRVFWMTDRDDIAPNREKTYKALETLCSVIPFYTEDKFCNISGGRQFDENHAATLDLLSATDLVAGTLERIFTKSKRPDETKVKDGAVRVLKWLTNDGICLKKLAMAIYRGDDGRLMASSMKFKPKGGRHGDRLLEGIFVPIYLE